MGPVYPDDDTPIKDDGCEAALLGIVLAYPQESIATMRRQVRPAHFAQPTHIRLYQAILSVHETGAPPLPSLVANHLHGSGEIKDYRLAEYAIELYGNADDVAFLDHFIGAVKRNHASREAQAALTRASQMVRAPGDEDPGRIALAIAEEFLAVHREAALDGTATGEYARRAVPGAGFVLDVPDKIPALWGSGGDILWAQGEALTIFGPDGVGKTTVALQLVRARMGIDHEFLGYPVQPGRRVLWMAMDRPAQARRAAARLFTEADRDVLTEKLVVWQGPPPRDLARNPDTLAELAKEFDADTILLDSLKDGALGLSDEECGSGYNRARQKALVEGVELIELHHPVKNGANGDPTGLEHLYGSRWIAAGSGSVVNLHGEAGDPLVRMSHRKFPMNEVGPYMLAHDHTTGRTTVHHQADLLALVRASMAEGVTAKTAAAELFDAPKPSAAQVEKARRKLASLVASGHLVELPPGRSGMPATWHLGA